MAKKVVGRQNAGTRAGRTMPDHHHVLSGQILYLRDQDASGELFPEESVEAKIRLQGSGPR